MSTDYRMLCEYKETKNSEWKAYKNPDGNVWDSDFWGISCIKRAFMTNNGSDNDVKNVSKGVYDLYGHYRELSLVKDFSFYFKYMDSEEMIILSDFILDMAKVMKDVEKHYEYRWIISPDW